MASNFGIRTLSPIPRNSISPASTHIHRSKSAFLLCSKRQSSRFMIFSVSKGKEEVLSDDEKSRIITSLGTAGSTSVDKTSIQKEEEEQSFLDESSSTSDSYIGEYDEWKWPPWKHLPQRYKLIGTTSLAFVICNMDKVNLSIAIIPMSHQFGWNASMAGLVQSSFFWGYAFSQLPGGWLAKIFGGREVLEIGVLTWSLATILVPFVAGYMPGLVFSRILVGIGEGVSPSAATDLIARQDY